MGVIGAKSDWLQGGKWWLYRGQHRISKALVNGQARYVLWGPEKQGVGYGKIRDILGAANSLDELKKRRKNSGGHRT